MLAGSRVLSKHAEANSPELDHTSKRYRDKHLLPLQLDLTYLTMHAITCTSSPSFDLY